MINDRDSIESRYNICFNQCIHVYNSLLYNIDNINDIECTQFGEMHNHENV